MNKKLILGLALAVVLVSGSLFSAQAECNLGCLPHISSFFSVDREPARDRDCADRLITPEPMGSAGY